MGPSIPLRWLGVVSALGLATACTDDPCEGRDFEPPPEPEPSPSTPSLISGEWIGGGVLELSFSQPLSSNGDLDPNRFAIVGWDAIAYSSGDTCYLSTRYRELTTGGYYYYGGSGVAAAWIGPEDNTRLRLRLSNSGASCRIVANSRGSGIMLAYTNVTHDAVGSKLLDEDGDPIADIGPAWAIQQLDGCLDSNYYYCGVISQFANGHLPALTSLLAIPCP